MRKNTTTPLMKACITESLLLLLQEKGLDDISVLEIVDKAGVNRSTYYRHFDSKADIVRHFYRSTLDLALDSMPGRIGVEDYFTHVFAAFLAHRERLLRLERLGLTFLLSEVLNERIGDISGSRPDPANLLYSYYHVGGVFNCFRYWVQGGMVIPARELARQCVQMLPEDFVPRLWDEKN